MGRPAPARLLQASLSLLPSPWSPQPLCSLCLRAWEAIGGWRGLWGGRLAEHSMGPGTPRSGSGARPGQTPAASGQSGAPRGPVLFFLFYPNSVKGNLSAITLIIRIDYGNLACQVALSFLCHCLSIFRGFIPKIEKNYPSIPFRFWGPFRKNIQIASTMCIAQESPGSQVLAS